MQGEKERKNSINRAYTKRLLQVHLPGMRIYKTALVVFLCLLYDHVVQAGNIVDAPIAGIVCLQQGVRSTADRSLQRIIGTSFAGVYTLGFLWLFRVQLGMQAHELRYYLMMSLFLIPLMHIVVRLHQKGAVSIAAIVFVLVALGDKAAVNPVHYVAMRCLNTIGGVLIALFVDWLPPLNRLEAWRLRKLELEKEGEQR